MSAPAPGVPLGVQYRGFRDRAKAGRPVDFEALLRGFHQAILQPGDVAVDVGGYKGTHAKPMAEAVRGTGRAGAGALHVFEANPEMADGLRQLFSAPGYGHVTVHQAAAAEAAGESDFVLALDSPGYSGLKEREYDQPDMRTQSIRVRVVRLDEALGGLDRLAFLKIDVEGGEFGVLRGAEGLVTRLRPAIGFEFGRRSYGAYGVDPGEVFDWFATRGYVLFDVVGNFLGTRERFLRSDSIPGLWDYLAVPTERGEWKRLARAQAGRVGEGSALPGPHPPGA